LSDSGAVQSNYALPFTTQLPPNPIGNLPIRRARRGLTESALPAAFATNLLNHDRSANLLTGTTSENLTGRLGHISQPDYSLDHQQRHLTATLGAHPH